MNSLNEWGIEFMKRRRNLNQLLTDRDLSKLS
jgi:hypothetical protein